MNRFKGLDLVDRASEELWTEVHSIVKEGSSDQNHPKEKEMQEGKGVVWAGFTNTWEKKWKAREKGKDIPNWMKSSRE